MVPFSTVNNVTQVIPIPYPPADNLLVDEFTITPPGPFSLNDLLAERITELYGVVYNGSFDTTYERYAISIATLTVTSLTTAVYLNISSAIVPYPELRYYSYPRMSPSTADEQHVYLAHQIHAAPDFDQIVHAVFIEPSCSCVGCSGNGEIIQYLQQPGGVWAFPGYPNVLDSRLMGGDNVVANMTTESGAQIQCKVQVLEEIHCVVGPAFADRC